MVMVLLDALILEPSVTTHAG